MINALIYDLPAMSVIALGLDILALLTNELKEVTDPHRLGIKLGIESSDVTRIIQDAGSDTEKQKTGILDHWLKNDSNASWPTLVKALKEMDHKRLAERLEKTYCVQVKYIGMGLYIKDRSRARGACAPNILGGPPTHLLLS